MKSRRKFTVGFVIAVLVTTGLVMWRAHTRDISSGSFHGFEIDASREVVLRRISELGTNAISAFDPNQQLSSNKDEFESFQFDTVESLVVTNSQEIAFAIDFSQGMIEEFGSGPDAPFDTQLQVGDPATKVKKVLLDAFITVPNLRVYSTVKRDPVSGDRGVAPGKSKESSQMIWLFSKNGWFFGQSGTYRNYHLTFSNDRLSRIQYINYFVEPP